MTMTIDTSNSSFALFRSKNRYYVDKTMLIADMLKKNDNGVYLYTRPRRFGKSLNLSMLDAFFNIEYRGNTWFDGLEISDYHEYDEYKNKFPVIKLDLKGLSCNSLDEFRDSFRKAVQETFIQHEYLLSSDKLSDYWTRIIESVMSETISWVRIQTAVEDLCKMLFRHHGQRAVVLIDEYDNAINKAFGTDFQDEMIEYLGMFLTNTLKSNDCLQMAYMTGVSQIPMSGMYSGLNNVIVDNVISGISRERFGFTESEVRSLLDYYNVSDRFDEVRNWYDGYRFGTADVYNPYSILRFIECGLKAAPYWINTSSDVPLRWMLDHTNARGVPSIVSILSGGSSVEEVNMNVCFEDLRYKRIGAMFTLMLQSGYLKAEPIDDERYNISVPNREVMGALQDLLNKSLGLNHDLEDDLITAFLDHDTGRMAETFDSILNSASYFDCTEERYYAIMVLLSLRPLTKRYGMRSQVENGNGRIDILLTPTIEGMEPIVIEIKRTTKEDELPEALDKALKQIRERRYYHGMKGKVTLMGMAFCGKVSSVRIEDAEIQ